MKKILVLIAIGTLALSALGQTSDNSNAATQPTIAAQPVGSPITAPRLDAPPADPTTFFGSVQNYFTMFSDLKTFQSQRGEVAAGMDYQSGVNISASLRVSYNVWQPTNSNTFLSVESTTRNAGVAGTIVSQQLGVGWNVVVKDVKLTAYGSGGYDFYHDRIFAAVGARASKALTDHTFAGLGIEAQIQKKPTPLFTAFTGFTF